MSTTVSTAPRPSLVPAAALSAVVSALLLAFAAWGDGAEDHPARRFLITLTIAIATTIPVFGWAVPRARRTPDGSTAIVLAALALLSIGVYWLGPTAVLGTGAIVAGWGRKAPLQRAAVALGTLAVIAFAALSLLELIR